MSEGRREDRKTECVGGRDLRREKAEGNEWEKGGRQREENKCS